MEDKTQALYEEVKTSAAEVMGSVGLANYVWDVSSDTLVWSENFADLIGFKEGVFFQSGRNFEKLLSIESPETRFGTVLSSESNTTPDGMKNGFAFKCVYAVSAQNTIGEQDIWIEDSGRWYPGENGKPAKVRGLVRIINERRQTEEKMRRQTDYDDLTGLPNKRVLQEQIAKSAQTAIAENKSCGFLLVSVERLELINSIYGYETGDALLIEVAKRISSLMRDGDMVARFSGAKFAVLLEDCSGGEVFIAAKRFIANLEDSLIETESGHLAVRASVGACLIPRHATTVADAMSAVTIALNEAKHDTSLRIALFDPDPTSIAKFKHQALLANEIVKAINEDERVTLAFQPVVSASHHSVAFHEALLRMKMADGSVQDAGDFIPTAERLGLIRFVDYHAQRLCLETLKQCPDAKLSLNVSHETAEDPAWILKLASGLSETQNGAERLIVEVTESYAAKDLQQARNFVSMVRDLGCRVAVDDFGAGYTSFSNLRDIKVDIIKIDGAFCRELTSNRQNEVFIRSLLDLANALEVETVVEWVEDVETAALLSTWGVTYLQGQVFGMPLQVAPWEKKAVEGNTATDKNQQIG